ncbi:MAG: uroporphyrinogen-III synthase [Pseudomonadota bacterium]
MLVTRPRNQAEALCQLIEFAGGSVFRFPVLEIVRSRKWGRAVDVLHNLERCRWIFFVSANAVHFAQQAYNDNISFPAGLRIAAIGSATARALEAAKIRVDLMPKEQFNSEALLELPEFASLSGQRCVIVRGEGGRELLADGLKQRGATVEYAEVYRREVPRYNPSGLMDQLARGGIQVVTVTSVETFFNLLSMVGHAGEVVLKETPLVVMSQRIRNAALDRGFARVAVAEKPAGKAVVDAIIKLNIRGQSVARAKS